jgi:formate/nitrite transporter
MCLPNSAQKTGRGGLAFSLGLILVIVGGAELFTGNNLLVMAWASGLVPTSHLLKNWAVVYLGNFVGGLGTTVGVYLSRQWTFDAYRVGATALTIAHAKGQYDFLSAFTLGAFCNALVCLAVWLCFSTRATTDKIVAIVPPITAFVATGFEHEAHDMAQGGLGSSCKRYCGLEPVGADLAVQRASIGAENVRRSHLMPAGLAQNRGDVVPFQFLQRRSM